MTGEGRNAVLWKGCLGWAFLGSAVWPGVSRADPPADEKHGCLVASDQGQADRDEGKYRAARKAFLTCARSGCPAVVLGACTRWLKGVDDAAPTIVLDVKDERGNDVSDVTVTFDGEPFATVADGKPIEADSGTHVLRFEREGSLPAERSVTLHAGERAHVVAVSLEPSPVRARSGDEAASERERLRQSRAFARIVTTASLGVGAAAAAVLGGYFVRQSSQRAGEGGTLRSELGGQSAGGSSACTGAATSTLCQTLTNKVQEQHDTATDATVAFVGAGALAAGAVAAWLLWPAPRERPAQSSAWIEPTQGGVALRLGGTF
jgi:hypothetical protein